MRFDAVGGSLWAASQAQRFTGAFQCTGGSGLMNGLDEDRLTVAYKV
jgi:hypothetical protein